MKVIIVDSSNVCYAAYGLAAGLSNSELESFAIYHFFKNIYKMVKEYKTNRFVFCWDSRKYKRREIFTGYKDKSVKSAPAHPEIKEHIDFQMGILMARIIPSFFTNSFVQTGYEADDLIASTIQNNPQYDYVVCSTDKDMYQLLAPNVVIHKPRNDSKDNPYTEKDFIKEYMIDPSQWVEAKCLAGDKSDGVPGLHRVGIPTAINYILGIGRKNSVKEQVAESKELIERNKKLMSLPYPGTNKVKLKFPDYIPRSKFTSFCTENNLFYFIQKSKLKNLSILFEESYEKS